MTTEQIIGLILALLVMCVGVAGSILPGLPSTPVVLIAAIAHKLYFGPTGAAWWVMVILAAFTVISLVVDYAASVYGAKKLGATWRGAVGSIVGGLIGLFCLSNRRQHRTRSASEFGPLPRSSPC